MFVNDYEAKVLDVEADTGTLTVDVPRKLLKAGKQRDQLPTGRPRPIHVRGVLSGFVAADKLKNTTNDWHVTRYHEPAPLELDGQEIPRGFDILQGSFTSFRNPLTQLPVGKRGQRGAANRAERSDRQYARRAVGIPRRHRAVAQRNVR